MKATTTKKEQNKNLLQINFLIRFELFLCSLVARRGALTTLKKLKPFNKVVVIGTKLKFLVDGGGGGKGRKLEERGRGREQKKVCWFQLNSFVELDKKFCFFFT